MEQPPTRKKITRKRDSHSCLECRRRKLKCDRRTPCTACDRRNDADSCIYTSTKGRSARMVSEATAMTNERRLRAEERLEHLEELIKRISNTDSTAPLTTVDNITAIRRSGETAVDEVRYHGATHWSAMLDDIQELRGTIVSEDDDDDDDDDQDIVEGGLDEDGRRLSNQTPGEGFPMIPQSSSSIPIAEVLAGFLPPRREADRLVASYFRSKSLCALHVHAGQFRRLYNRFWEAPTTAPPLWIALLFCVLDIASTNTTASAYASTTPTSSSTTDVAVAATSRPLATAAAQCLSIGRYCEVDRAFAVEALTLYVQARVITAAGNSTELAVLTASVMRLAVVRGYHRDPEGYRPSLSPFAVEMRRRTWSVAMQLDLLVCFRRGVPSAIPHGGWDTRSPANLLDSDFDEDTVIMPQPRPFLDPTERILYFSKHHISVVFEQILFYTSRLESNPTIKMAGDAPPSTPSDEQMLTALDAQLRATYDECPDVLKIREMQDSVTDSPSLLVARLCLLFIYQNSMCALHRGHVARGRLASVRACYEAATDLLASFLDVVDEFQPGGQLETERWFMGDIIWYQFLTAAAALCLVIASVSSQPGLANSTTLVNYTSAFVLLNGARRLCSEQAGRNEDTKRVRRMIDATMVKFGRKNQRHNAPVQESTNPNPLYIDPVLSDPTLDWPWIDGVPESTDEMTWTYLEELLNLPNE